MPRGGARVGSGRRKKSAVVDRVEKPLSEVKQGDRLPLVYMLDVMNDPDIDEGRRDRMAVAAAPYLHAKVADTGKKEDRKKSAEQASKGKFSPAAPPRLVVNNE